MPSKRNVVICLSVAVLKAVKLDFSIISAVTMSTSRVGSNRMVNHKNN